jgi:hypothetical protein
MNDFPLRGSREALSRFRDAVHREAERSESPGLQAILAGERPAKDLRFRWAVAASVALAVGAIPAYVHSYESARERQREAAQAEADATADSLLVEQVNAGLSRSVPRAMTPLAGWAPAGK